MTINARTTDDGRPFIVKASLVQMLRLPNSTGDALDDLFDSGWSFTPRRAGNPRLLTDAFQQQRHPSAV